jgi:hypothetical protein
MTDEARSPLSPGSHEAVDLGDDDGPILYESCDIADLDRVGNRDPVPIYDLDHMHGRRPANIEVERVPWPPPRPPLSPPERAHELVKQMLCVGVAEPGVTYEEAVGPPPPPYSPRAAAPRSHEAQDQDSDPGDASETLAPCPHTGLTPDVAHRDVDALFADAAASILAPRRPRRDEGPRITAHGPPDPSAAGRLSG